MLGAIAGDVVGSVYEFHPWQGNLSDFPLFSKNSRFTDDTVLTLVLNNIEYFVFNVKIASPKTRFRLAYGGYAAAPGLRLGASTPKHFMFRCTRLNGH